MSLTPTDKVLLCALALCGFLQFFVQEYIIRFYRYFLAKRVEVVIEKEVPIVVKEEIPVIVTDRIESHVYQIEEGLCFDADSRILRIRGYLSQMSSCTIKMKIILIN